MVTEKGKRRTAQTDIPINEYHGDNWFELDENGTPVMEWKKVAQVLDRIFFVCYIFGMAGSLAFVFPR